jgi:predicted flap endonuclease-1-like 5' DNA nuclease
MDRWWLSIVAVVVPLLGFLVPLILWGVFQRHGEESTMAWLREAAHHGEHGHGHGHAAEPGHVEVVAAPPSPPVSDDLKRIEGIGPKIATVLNEAGITTFAQLAGRGADELKQIVTDGGVRIAFTETWPEQAALAAAGEWKKLEELQEALQGGRRE